MISVPKSWKQAEEDNDIAKATLLSHMQDDLIPLFEDCKTTKEILIALEIKYGGKSTTQHKCYHKFQYS